MFEAMVVIIGLGIFNTLYRIHENQCRAEARRIRGEK